MCVCACVYFPRESPKYLPHLVKASNLNQIKPLDAAANVRKPGGRETCQPMPRVRNLWNTG